MIFAVPVDNRTPFSATTNVQLNADGQEVLVVMFSASFRLSEAGGPPEPAENPLVVTLGDVPSGAPGRSSTRYDSDTCATKPGVDVIANATAYAPKGKPVREMQVGLQVGAVRKVLQVMGDRLYDMGSYSAPHPFTKMPIVYERAYGGATEDGRVDPRNPVGVGYHHAPSADPAVRTQAPNITYPGEPYLSPSDRPRPAGFGVVSRGWQPRVGYAGTYDQSWRATQWPLPARDFDDRHNLCAPPDQQLKHLASGEAVTLIGMTPSGRLEFAVPTVTAPIRLAFDDRIEEHAFKPDALIIEPDLSRVTLKARLSMVAKRNGPALRSILFGHATPALVLAHRKRKPYFAGLGGDGTVRGSRAWR
ncbi:MAG: DUF2169 domain-containing protein [Rhizobiaceae bacterium]